MLYSKPELCNLLLQNISNPELERSWTAAASVDVSTMHTLGRFSAFKFLYLVNHATIVFAASFQSLVKKHIKSLSTCDTLVRNPLFDWCLRRYIRPRVPY